MRNMLSRAKQRISALLLDRREKRHSWVGPPELWKMKRDFQIDFLKKHGLVDTNYFLDLGCGTLRGGIPVIEHLEVGHYFGIDVRPEVLQEAVRELSEANLTHKKPTLILMKDADLLGDRQFDFVWAFSVLIHMDDSTLRKTLLFVRSRLIDTGAFYANVNVGAALEGQWQGFPVVTRPLHFYQSVAEEAGLTVEDIGGLSALGHRSGVMSQDEQRMLLFSIKPSIHERTRTS